ncbi:MAG: NifB/NifX family molybdenum-iron cluster-binding protein [Chloroflexota bacterium]|nr:NifB/NifX family molybdenum-iron cluster-binding protein [Chloroflexota bacterium]
MIIMISSKGETLQSQPNLRFGRAPFFIEYNLSDDAWTAQRNEAVKESSGAGVSTSQYIINQQASAVISGNFGPNAQRALSYAGIKMLTFDDTYKTIQSVIEGFKSNRLEEF